MFIFHISSFALEEELARFVNNKLLLLVLNVMEFMNYIIIPFSSLLQLLYYADFLSEKKVKKAIYFDL